MSVARLAVSFDEKLAREVRRAAGRQATSAWLADAARRKLNSQGLLSVVEDWETEHGVLTQAELDTAARKITSRRPRRKR
jgi:hypothetical protein